MKMGRLAFFIILIFASAEISNAAIPLIEFNMTSTEGEGVLEKLPHRYLPIKNSFVWTDNGTTYFNLSKLVDIPIGSDYFFSSNNPKNVIVEIDQERKIVGVRPRKGWMGEEEVIIFLDGIGGEAIKSVENIGNDALISSINLQELDSVFFDDTLYSLFATRTGSIFEARKDADVEMNVAGRLDMENNIVVVDVGRDVEIITSFYGSEGKNKPSIKIVIDAGLVKYNSEVGHCSDGVRNYDEIDIDCGGECEECRIGNNNIFLVNLVLIILFGIGVGYAVLKYGKLPVRKTRKIIENKKISLADVRIDTIREIKVINSQIREDNIKRSIRLLSRLVRKYFRILFHIKYSFTYNELEKELVNRKIKTTEKDGLLRLFKRISMAEYGNYKLTKEQLTKLVDEALDIITRLELRR